MRGIRTVLAAPFAVLAFALVTVAMFSARAAMWISAGYRGAVKVEAEYPGLFEIHSDSGDIALNQVATRQTLEALRASINDALAQDDLRRRRRR